MNNKMNQLFTLIELKRLYPDAKSIELDVNQNCYWVETVGFSSHSIMDSIGDLAINHKAMVNYNVNIISYHRSVTILVSDGVKGSKVIRSTYRSDDLLPKAIIECILKSKGIYHDSI